MKNQHVSGRKARRLITDMQKYQQSAWPVCGIRFMKLVDKCETIPVARMLRSKALTSTHERWANERLEALALKAVFNADSEIELKRLRDVAPKDGDAEKLAQSHLNLLVWSGRLLA